MGQLSIFLPPFASDYTGVCSTLFDFDCLTAINDPSCCTTHYVHYDEPRWNHQIRPIFCTALRNIDAILGNDAKVVRAVCDAVGTLDTQMAALVGTPVPAITGMDMGGISREIEALSGRVTLGFNTSGYHYYDKGIAAAGKALFTRYAASGGRVIKNSVNILGMTPLDYGDVGNDIALREWLENAGWRVNANFFMGTSLDEVRRAGQAQFNLAVSAVGVVLAKYLKARFGTPWIAASPMGLEYSRTLPERIFTNRAESGYYKEARGNGLLIVTDQVIGISIREALWLAGCRRRIDVAGFFGWAPELAGQNDTFLSSERHLMELLRSGDYQSIAADPIFSHIPEVAGLKHYKITHPAVSGRLDWKNVPQYLSQNFENLICGIANHET